MKNTTTTSFLTVLALAGVMTGPLQAAGTLSGDHTVEASGGEDGDLNVQGSLKVDGTADLKSHLGLGTANGQPALQVTYSEDGSLYKTLFSAYRTQAIFEWWDNLQNPGGEVRKMTLDGDNALRLFSNTYTGSGTDGLIELQPAVNGASTILVDGVPVVVANGSNTLADLIGGNEDSLSVGEGAETGAFTNAIALGNGVIVTADGQIIVGRFNAENADQVFAVGNGLDGANRSTALGVDADGDVNVGRDLAVARNSATSGDAAIGGDAIVYGTLRVAPSGNLSMGAFSSGPSPVVVLDSATSEYVAEIQAAGANLTLGKRNRINELVTYLKDENLWDDASVLLLSSDYNAGAGTVAYSLGGWTGNDADLKSAGSTAPAWNAGGLIFDGSSAYAQLDLPGLQGATELTVMAYLAPDDASAPDAPHGVLASFGRGTEGKTVNFGGHTGHLNGETWTRTFSGGSLSNVRLATSETAFSYPGGESFVETVEMTTGTNKLWKDKTAITLDMELGGVTTATDMTPSATGYTGDNLLNIGAAYTGQGMTPQYDGRLKCLLVFKTTLTDTQREALVDLAQSF